MQISCRQKMVSIKSSLLQRWVGWFGLIGSVTYEPYGHGAQIKNLLTKPNSCSQNILEMLKLYNIFIL